MMRQGRWLAWSVWMLSAAAHAVDVDTHLHDASHADSALNYADETLSGDWSGARTRWAAQGVHVNLALKTDLLRHRGGLRSGAQAMWHLEAEVAADFDRLYGWKGWAGHLQIVDDRGGRVNERAVGSLMGVSNLEVNPAATRVLHAWVQYEAGAGHLATLVGLYPVDSEFSVIESAAMFSHPAYGPPADLSLTNKASLFPVSALGVRVKAQSAGQADYVQVALLDALPDDPNTEIRLRAQEGAFGIAEWGRMWPQGKLAVGAWAYSKRAPDQVDNTAQRRYGGYLLADSVLWQRNDTTRVHGFVRYSGTDGHTTALGRVLNLGLRVAAPFAGRPNDTLGLAFTRGFTSAGYRQVQGATAHEDAVEIAYRWQATPYCVLQPLLQRQRHPSANPALRESTVAGLRIEVIL
jgi:porin